MGGAGRAAGRIEDRQRLSGIVGKEFLAGPVLLAHRPFELARVVPIKLAELRVTVAGVGAVGFDVFFPQQLQGDPLAPQLAVDQSAVGWGAFPFPRRGLGEQPGFDVGFVDVRDQRPAHTFALGATDDLRDGAQTHAQCRHDLSVAQPTVEFESKYFLDLAHGYSLCRHVCSPEISGDCCRGLVMRNPLPQLLSLPFRHREHPFRNREHLFRKTRKVFTFNRNSRSPSTEISVHVEPKWAFTIDRNTQ